jgi:integrase
MGDPVFSSALGQPLQEFLAEKRAVGYRYNCEAFALRAFDRWLIDIGHGTVDLPKTVVDCWLQGKPHQSDKTRQLRSSLVRGLADFLIRQGIEAYIPGALGTPVARNSFVAWVFTRAQIRQLLDAIDAFGPDARSRQRHLVFPTLFCVLYGCGLRCGEALGLTGADVGLEAGVLTIREGKFRQDRLVPLAGGLLERLRRYSAAVGRPAGDAAFFPAQHGGSYSLHAPYTVFRRALRAIGIPHHGRGHGPRVHDIRHTFAVHRLEDWFRRGADLGAKLPVLATYMGHQSLVGTQRYLRLTAEVFPDISQRLHLAYGHLIPGGSER